MARSFGNNGYSRAVAVTPSDSTDLTGCKAIYVGGAGNLSLRMLNGGATLVFTAPTQGRVIDVPPIDRIMAATTATLLIAYF